MRQTIKYLGREYELATSDEIALACGAPVSFVRRTLEWQRDCAGRDMNERKVRGVEPDQNFVAIMRRRLAERRERCAA